MSGSEFLYRQWLWSYLLLIWETWHSSFSYTQVFIDTINNWSHICSTSDRSILYRELFQIFGVQGPHLGVQTVWCHSCVYHHNEIQLPPLKSMVKSPNSVYQWFEFSFLLQQIMLDWQTIFTFFCSRCFLISITLNTNLMTQVVQNLTVINWRIIVDWSGIALHIKWRIIQIVMVLLTHARFST